MGREPVGGNVVALRVDEPAGRGARTLERKTPDQTEPAANAAAEPGPAAPQGAGLDWSDEFHLGLRW